MKKPNKYRYIDFHSEFGHTADPLIPALLLAVAIVIVIAVKLLLKG